MSEDIASLGIGVDATQVKSATGDLDALSGAAADAAGSVDAFSAAAQKSNFDTANFTAAIQKAAAAQYGYSAIQADSLQVSIAGDILRKTNIKEIAAEQAALATAANLASRAADVQIEQQRVLNQLLKEQNAKNFGQDLIVASSPTLANKSAKDSAAAMVAAFKTIEAEEAALALASTASAATQIADNEAVKISTLQIREPIVLIREAFRGDFSRMAGSVSLLGQAYGLISAATLPFILATGALVVGLAALAYEVFKGEQQLRQLEGALRLTGDYSGLTATQFDNLAHSISTGTGDAVGRVEKNLLSLVQTGHFTADVIELIAKNSSFMSQQTGENSDKFVKEFSKMEDGVHNFAVEFENNYRGSISSVQIEHIRLLEQEGQKAQAELELQTNLYNGIGKIAPPNLGLVESAWKTLSDQISNALQNIRDFGKASIGNQIVSIQGELDKKLELLSEYSPGSKLYDATKQQVAALNEQLITLDHLKNAQDINTAANAAATTKSHEQVTALEAVNATILKLKNNYQLAEQEVKDFNASFEKLPASQQQAKGHTEAEFDAMIRKKYDKADFGSKTSAQYTDADKELAKLNNTLQEHLNLQGLVGEQLQAQKIADDEIARIEKLRTDKAGDKIVLSNEEKAKVLAIAETTVHQNEVVKAQEAAYEAANGTAIKYRETLEGIDNAVSNFNISPQKGAAQKEAATIRYNQATDPLYQQNRNIAEQSQLLTMLGPQREIQKALDDAAYSAASRGLPLDKQDLTVLAQKLIVQQNLNAVDVAKTTIFNSSVSQQQRSISIQMQALSVMKDLYMTTNQYNVALTHLQQLQLQLNAEKSGKWTDSLKAGLHSLLDTGKTVTQQLTTTFSQFFTKLEDGFANSIGQAVVGAKDLGSALKSVAQQAIGDLISALVKMGEQWVIQQVIGTTAATTANSTLLTEQTALAPILAANAMNTSIISFGAAAIAGGSAFVTDQGIAQTFAIVGAIPKATGGMIGGSGGPTQDNHLVAISTGEYIVNAYATAKHKPLLDAINYGNDNPATGNRTHFADGGYVGNSNVGTQTHYFDFTNANFGGADPDVIQRRVHEAITKVYGPAIVKQAVRQTVYTQGKLNNRQKLNSVSGR
jgi:hypothetical protein